MNALPNLDDKAIAEGLELAAKATPGPWRYDGCHPEIHTPYHGPDGTYWLIISECREAPDQEHQCDQFGHAWDANYAFIAHARTFYPLALERIRELEEQLKCK